MQMLTKILTILATCYLLFLPVFAQQSDSVETPVIVQPGAPGQPTKVLPPSTKITLLAVSPKDVEFMQGMIMHHLQAVEMTELIESRTENNEIRRLGERIRQSQTDEINFMKRWLIVRNQPLMPDMEVGATDLSKHKHTMLMPGMLTPRQMEELRNAKGKEFDRLFLQRMIMHHEGALEMVRDLFASDGGQDAEIFNFATDVDNGQQAEIKRMKTILEKIP
jgi:uncharacterized protein (DUF305 family)